MLRHAALRPLSRGHQRILFPAREMRRDPAGALAAFIAYAREELPRHLEAEESVLFPAILARAPQGDPSVARARESHAAIRAAVEDVEASPAPDVVRAMARLLHDHVRDEERELFPFAERTLGDDGLSELAASLGDAYVI